MARMSTAELVERLDRLQDHRFITGWTRVPKLGYVIQSSVLWGPYTKAEAIAFVEGCNAMGAAP